MATNFIILYKYHGKLYQCGILHTPTYAVVMVTHKQVMIRKDTSYNDTNNARIHHIMTQTR